MKLSMLPVRQCDDFENIWADVVHSSPAAWYRHSYNLAEFHRSVAVKKNPEEHSFFVFLNDKVVGLCPIFIADTPDGYREMSYNGSPTPWPCFMADHQDIQEADIEAYVFQNILEMCSKYKVDRAVFGLNAPLLSVEGHEQKFGQVVRDWNFMDHSFYSHLVTVEDEYFANIRASYRRNIRKFSKKYYATSYIGKDVDQDIEEAYFYLHVKDAGGQFRPRESYTKMADLARRNEAAFFVVRENGSDKIVGVLVIAVFKDAAYDSSVSIDPDYHSDYISHILKAKALEFLNERGISHYELGKISNYPAFFDIPSDKEKNISFFKEGFARGGLKKSYVAEKYFNIEMLHKKIKSQEEKISHYFGIGHDR